MCGNSCKNINQEVTMMRASYYTFFLLFIIKMAFPQYTSEWTSGNLGQYGWGGAYGYDIDNDGLVEYYIRSANSITFYNGNYTVDWNVSYPGYDYVTVVQPRDIDGDGIIVPLNMDNDGAGEIVIAGYYYNTSNYTYYGRFRVYDATSHIMEFESPEITGFAGTASLEDIDGDGRDELIVSRYGSSTSSSYVDVYAYVNSATTGQSVKQYDKTPIHCTPNPARQKIMIPFTVTEQEVTKPLRVCIYDASGRIIKTLLTLSKPSKGSYNLMWDGTDNNGKSVASGNYFIVLEKGNSVSKTHIGMLSL
jgi:hypothetical protein